MISIVYLHKVPSNVLPTTAISLLIVLPTLCVTWEIQRLTKHVVANLCSKIYRWCSFRKSYIILHSRGINSGPEILLFIFFPELLDRMLNVPSNPDAVRDERGKTQKFISLN